MSRFIDPSSIAGKGPVPDQHVAVAVIGAGPAGLAAALATARAGLTTLLVDENPVSAGLMSLDVPLHFGQRMNGAVQNKGRLIERLVDSNPGLADAMDLGVEVQLGVYAWGAYANGESVGSLVRPVLGLADEERSWLVSFDHLIVAAGARDLAISFTGWEKPGVMGAQAAALLLRRYEAFAGRRLVILGGDTLGLHSALLAHQAGCGVVGIVEVEDSLPGPAALRERLDAAGIPIYAGHAVKQALGRAEVEGIELLRLDAQGQPVGGSEITLACDTIVTAIGTVPTVELLGVLGCRLTLDPALGGHVPVIDDKGRTSLPFVHAVGDGAGFSAARLLDSTLAAREGERIGSAVAAALGAVTPTPAEIPLRETGKDLYGHWQRWLDAELAVGGLDVMVCQCEEVTRREIVELRPPRYLNWGGSQRSQHDLRGLAQDGPLNQDQVKRLTRAGMGPCQGRRCREQIQLLLALTTGQNPATIPLASYRAPVRPLPLSLLGSAEEPAAVRDSWTAWFNIATQWTPHWEQQPAPLPADDACRPVEPAGK